MKLRVLRKPPKERYRIIENKLYSPYTSTVVSIGQKIEISAYGKSNIPAEIISFERTLGKGYNKGICIKYKYKIPKNKSYAEVGKVVIGSSTVSEFYRYILQDTEFLNYCNRFK